MELLLHYVWRHKIFPLQPLKTTAGCTLEVIDPGLPNPNAGPDFFNAKLKIDGVLWIGNVEVHQQASDWLKHGHDRDKAYDSVILHVVGEVNCDVYRTNGELIPQLLLSCPASICQRYAQLQRFEKLPPCHSILPSLPKLTVHSWFSALQVERFEQKAAAISARLERCNHHWEDVFFITLARNFGFGLNGDVFEAWAMRLPLRAVDKHRDQLFQIEAFFFGQAGLLEESIEDVYYQQLQKEFRYLQHKFTLPAPLSEGQWRMLRLRPDNFPHVRLAQLAHLYHTHAALFSQLMEAETPDAARHLLRTSTSAYWEEHFTFKKSSPHSVKRLGEGALNLILINTVIPFLYAYGQHKANEAMTERATRFLEMLKAENNYVTRIWTGMGLPVTIATAADSQALLQLQKQYCDRHDCLRCRFGYEFLKGRKLP